MPLPRQHLSVELTASFAGIRQRLGVVDEFPELVIAAAQRAASAPLPASPNDRRDVELLSIDPAGSRDLDQALHLERRGSGYRFHYAIADVAGWVQAGDPVDAEARHRGTTIYCPDRRVPLHPPSLSDGAASLLDTHDAPAILWTIDLDQRGEIAAVAVERALVRNRRALSYQDVQRALDDGTADEAMRLIAEVGSLRLSLEAERGGVSLDLPEQVVERVDDHYELRYDAALPVEGFNAQLSLCCGMAAAKLMLDAKCGIVRTLPAADPRTIERLRLHSVALGVPWDPATPYPQWVRSLDATTAAGAALMTQAARTLRGATYLPFDGVVPPDHAHHALAADYAHVTAPLRRLVDRFANECVLAAAAGTRPPGWTLDALETLPAIMATAAHVSSQVDHAVVDVAEAAALQHLVGQRFEAVVTATAHGISTVQLRDPAVIGSVTAELELGATVSVRLDAADVAGPTVRFSAVPGGS